MTLGKKLVIAFLSVVMLATVSVAAINLLSARSAIQTLIEERVNKELELLVEDTEHQFTSHENVARSAAATYVAMDEKLTKAEYRDILENMLKMNQATLGAGIWLEPNTYENEQYFGPYVYKDGSELVYTLDYEDPAYDYPNTDWYLLGKNLDGQSGWTDPYYDETSGITMITTAVPIIEQDKIIGVVSADYDLSTIQELIENVQIEKSGFAFLIDNTGLIIAHKDPGIRMNMSIQDEPEYGVLLEKMMTQDQGDVRITREGKDYVANYTSLPRTGWKLVTMAPINELFASIYNMSYRSVGVALIVILIAIGISYIISKKIADSIKLFQKSIEYLAHGDFTHEHQVKSKDEIGDMGRGYNNILSSLKNIIQKIMDSSDNVAATAEELAVSTEETSKSIVEVASSIQELASSSHEQSQVIGTMKDSMDHIYTKMDGVSSRLGTTKDSVEETQKYVGKGENYVQQAIAQIEEINQQVTKSSKTIFALNEKSKQIEEIIDIISGISEQTNLLALNASIEAARAGEQGRGFAVVAGEVGKLAEASAKSSANISQLIHEIQKDIKASTDVMEASQTATSNGIHVIEKTGKAFKTISESMNEVSLNTSGAVKSGDEILEEIEHIRDSISRIADSASLNDMNTQNVSAATQEQTAIIEQIQTATEQLADIATELQNEVKAFKIN
jgi:methyl-accepting chemotaxis protein